MPMRDGDSTGKALVTLILTDKEKIREEGLIMEIMEILEVVDARNEALYKDYGKDWVSFWIVERDVLDEWDNIQNIQAFKWALANANNPPFDPEGDLDIPDRDGTLYDEAVLSAWDELIHAREEVMSMT